MPESRTINLETLTPLWTDGVDATSEVARATGIVGWLRWWYEAIQRAFGHRCCDPSNHDPKDPHCPCDGRKAYCEACQTYGATGRGRPLRIELNWPAEYRSTSRRHLGPTSPIRRSPH